MSMRELLRRLIREPLLHFLVAGALVFAWFAWRGHSPDPESRTIVVTEGKAARLAAGFAQTWRRPPTEEEMDSLIRDYIREEIYNREAKRLQLDLDDPVIRRRLRAKMEFLAAAEVEGLEPDAATLEAFRERNADRYALPPSFSFDQIYLSTNSQLTAADLRRALAAGADWTTLGEEISLPRSLERTSASEIARIFGEEFAQSLAMRAPGGWHGPVASGFGLHLVRVRESIPARNATLAEARQRIENDWRAATRAEREDRAFRALLEGYTIRIEAP
jgi:hypothetical protein